MNTLMYKRFLLVKDKFYTDPEKTYKAALSASYYEPAHVTGLRSTAVYHEPGVKTKLEKILGIKITRWDTDPIEENGVFYQGFSKGRTKETPGVHSDEPYNDITVVIYLTPDLPVDCGTSLWMHKKTGLCDPPMPRDARRLKTNLSKLRDRFERESKDRTKWIETDRVGYKFNRMIAYPSGALHSASKHYGGNLANGRLYQTFRIGVDWNTFIMSKS
ncbi:MAG: hypothetical protein IPP15_09695 [Saprospiraceae bacterium]|uniref:Uncharacterized protein n=1 Tax=Candidatus Opimibacter skivensis TaxID=2982028 RepID=A0A9D7XSM3_9BACT|nr:hypothetical protein [Candidatus Opimibacter skivensis]